MQFAFFDQHHHHLAGCLPDGSRWKDAKHVDFSSNVQKCPTQSQAVSLTNKSVCPECLHVQIVFHAGAVVSVCLLALTLGRKLKG